MSIVGQLARPASNHNCQPSESWSAGQLEQQQPEHPEQRERPADSTSSSQLKWQTRLAPRAAAAAAALSALAALAQADARKGAAGERAWPSAQQLGQPALGNSTPDRQKPKKSSISKVGWCAKGASEQLFGLSLAPKDASKDRSAGKQRNSIIAHASTNLVDRLAHMIKKSSTPARAGDTDLRAAAATGAAAAVNKGAQSPPAAAESAAQTQAGESGAAAGSSGRAGNNRWMLGELSWRLVRRYTLKGAKAAHTQAPPSSKSNKGATGNASPSNSANDDDRAGAVGATNKSAGRAANQTDPARRPTDTLGNAGAVNLIAGATPSSMASAIASSLAPSTATLLSAPFLDHPDSPQASASQPASQSGQPSAPTSLANDQQHNININSSISTLTSALATPTGCCYCDENCQSTSSGFISSSTGINCSDSIATHSCASSTYNDHPPAEQSQHHHQQQHYQLAGSPLAEATWMGEQQSPKSPPLLAVQSASEQALVEEHSANDPIAPPRAAHSSMQPLGGLNLSAGSPGAHLEPPPGDHQGAQCAANEDQPTAAKKDQRKTGGSFLSRARNSTINLASLATVTQKFNCSASVGNLWPLNGPAGAHSSGSQTAQHQRSELAQLSGDSHNVKPIEYVVRGTFDDYDNQSDSNNNNNSHPAKSEQASQPGARKSSAKEKEKKNKRQKDGEKIEKLRLLVSYLRSGSGQNLPHPVALEADELELAQKYKLHLILCEDCLKVAEQQQQQRDRDNYLLLGLMPTSSTPSMSALAGQARSPGGRPAGSSDTLPVSPIESSQPTAIGDILVSIRHSSVNANLGADSAQPLPLHLVDDKLQLSSSCSSHLLTLAANQNSVSSPAIGQQQHPLSHPIARDAHALPDHGHQHQPGQPPMSPGCSSAVHEQRMQLLQEPKQHQLLLCYKCHKPTGRSKSSLMSSVDVTASASVASDMDSTLGGAHYAAHQSPEADRRQPDGQADLEESNATSNNHNNNTESVATSDSRALVSSELNLEHDHHHCHLHRDHNQHGAYDAAQELQFLSSYRSVPGGATGVGGTGMGGAVGASDRSANGATRAHVRIGQVSWTLRHSISDPGASYDRLQQHNKPIGTRGGTGRERARAMDDQSLVSTGSVFGSSISGRAQTLSLSRGSNGAVQLHFNQQHQQQHPQPHQSPKMFYIDDMERKNSDSSDTNNSQLAVSQSQSACLAHTGNDDADDDGDDDDDEGDNNGARRGQYAPRSRRRSAKAAVSSGEAVLRGLPPRSWSSELFLSSTPTTTTATTTTSATSTSTTTSTTTTAPKISYTPTADGVQLACSNNNTHLSGDTDRTPQMPAGSTGARTSAWTTPQNLATWIDNEVNSLVNDLETESQLVKSEKLAKSSKRKWLTGNPIRRNSSGAHST